MFGVPVLVLVLAPVATLLQVLQPLPLLLLEEIETLLPLILPLPLLLQPLTLKIKAREVKAKVKREIERAQR